MMHTADVLLSNNIHYCGGESRLGIKERVGESKDLKQVSREFWKNSRISRKGDVQMGAEMALEKLQLLFNIENLNSTD